MKTADRPAGDCCIINISSLLGLKDGKGSSVYAASKAGIIGFSRALALEHSPRNVNDLGIRVNTIAPGYVDTAMTKGQSMKGIKPSLWQLLTTYL